MGLKQISTPRGGGGLIEDLRYAYQSLGQATL